MFAEDKKNFYSVNADIAIDANQQQRHFEYRSRAVMMESDYHNAMAMSNSMMGGAGASNADESQQMYGNDDMNEQAQYENEITEQHQMQLMMLEEQLTGPQAVRYDQIYYPRTDKRSISK